MLKTHALAAVIRILKGDGDSLMGYPTVIASAENVDEAVDAFRAGATGIHINGEFVFRDQLEEEKKN